MTSQLPQPTVISPRKFVTGKPGGPAGRRKPKKPVLKELAYDLAYGSDSAAQPGMVMLRIAREGTILAELNMPPEEFLTLAHSFEVVARAVAADLL